MNVYLFSLDSVRNSREEIVLGQREMFRSIVRGGNTVVLSYNQLTDSAAFWAGLRDDETYAALMTLCREGRIRVSLFGGQRTAAQYILEHIERCLERLERPAGAGEGKQFYFSLLPLSADEGSVLRDVRDAIRFSDLRLLKERAADPAAGDKYRFLYKYAEIILLLSRGDTTVVPARREGVRGLMDFLGEACAMTPPEGELGELLPGAAELLRRVSAGHDAAALAYRSVWYRLLESEPYSDTVGLAEAIVDLCYNYSNENSMEGVVMSYRAEDAGSFRTAFLRALEAYWTDAREGRHVFHMLDEERRSAQFVLEDDAELPDWPLAARIVTRNADYLRRKRRKAEPEQGRTLEEEQRRWEKLTRRSLHGSMLLAGMYALVFVLINLGLDIAQDWMADELSISLSWRGRLLVDVLSIVLFGLFSSVAFSRFHLPDILETVRDIFMGIREARQMERFDAEYEGMRE